MAYSISASKVENNKKKPFFSFKVESPTFKVENFPIVHSAKRTKNDVFFSDQVPINELRTLGELHEEESENSPVSSKSIEYNKRNYRNWVSKSSTAKPAGPADFHALLRKRQVDSIMPLANTPPPPGFECMMPAVKEKTTEDKRVLWADQSDTDKTPTPISSISQKKFTWEPTEEEKAEKQIARVQQLVTQEQIVLKKPPAPKKITKRQDRGKFEVEQEEELRSLGNLKFYNKKKRFGFISMENEGDVFICEDDIIVSGLNLKDFKNLVNDGPADRIKFTFVIKTYEEKGRSKRKAVNIKIISY